MPAESSAPSIFYLSYLPVEEEAGAEMPFDFSHATAQDRWRAGFLDAQEANTRQARGDCAVLTPIRRTPSHAVWSAEPNLPLAVGQ
jgi:hypothetical protein